MEDMYLEKRLLSACYRNDVKEVKLLLEKGADINMRDGLPLTYACYYDKIEVVKLLLEYGADINVLDTNELNIDDYSPEVQELINNYIIEKELLKGK